ncbi:MAG: hypothetical protein ABI992_07775 [Chthoniobacterales bacterium]
MRPLIVLLLANTVFLLGCAQQGVIVEKESGPQPFYHSVGVDGSYAFLLRDQSGVTHRQLVTPEVFARYATGQYFNDLAPVPAAGMPEGNRLQPPDEVTLVPRIARVKKSERSTRIASHHRKSHQHLARRHKRHPASKIARARRSLRVAQARKHRASS